MTLMSKNVNFYEPFNSNPFSDLTSGCTIITVLFAQRNTSIKRHISCVNVTCSMSLDCYLHTADYGIPVFSRVEPPFDVFLSLQASLELFP